MRLIDADRLNEVIERNFCYPGCLKQIVDVQPTAYDVDKVVGQLEEKAKAYDNPASSDDGFRRYCRGIAVGYRYAADIVKAGGADEKEVE